MPNLSEYDLIDLARNGKWVDDKKNISSESSITKRYRCDDVIVYTWPYYTLPVYGYVAFRKGGGNRIRQKYAEAAFKIIEEARNGSNAKD